MSGIDTRFFQTVASSLYRISRIHQYNSLEYVCLRLYFIIYCHNNNKSEDKASVYRLCGYIDCVEISIVWNYRLCGCIDCMEISIVWIYRLCGNIDCVDVSIVWKYRQYGKNKKRVRVCLPKIRFDLWSFMANSLWYGYIFITKVVKTNNEITCLIRWEYLL